MGMLRDAWGCTGMQFSRCDLEKDNQVANIQMHETHMELLETISDLKQEVKELKQKAGHLEVAVILTREPALDMIAKKKFKNE